MSARFLREISSRILNGLRRIASSCCSFLLDLAQLGSTHSIDLLDDHFLPFELMACLIDVRSLRGPATCSEIAFRAVCILPPLLH